jgi:ATP-dependent Lon protease
VNTLLSGGHPFPSSRKAADIYPFLEAYIARKEKQVAEIEQVVSRYEIKRLKEERAYQSMSSLRRMFSGRTPDHHLAVEYIHYVKKPMEQVKKLRQDIEQARRILNESNPGDEVSVPSDIEQLF